MQELQVEQLRQRKKTWVAVTLGSLLIPGVLGAVLAPWLFPLAGERATPGSLAGFLAVALGITAFPVLARILAERNLIRSEGGTLALASVAVGDMVAWIALAIVVGSLTVQGGMQVQIVVGVVVYYWSIFSGSIDNLLGGDVYTRSSGIYAST